jgi:nicotinamide-nucleotide amidase
METNRHPTACVISIGTELVTGQSIDTNSAWISETLTSIGVTVESHHTVGDDAGELTRTIQVAHQNHDLVVITGGLGPTADDLTRECIAEALGVDLELSDEALRQVEDFFLRFRKAMPESNRKQAWLPRGCRVVPNPRGTAPGIHHVDDHRQIFALPGVPREMKAMFPTVEASLPKVKLPGLAKGRLLTFGMHEAALGELLADMMPRHRNPLVGTTASEAIISVRVIAKADTPEQARVLLESDLAELRNRLGNVVFAENEGTLASSAGGLLREQRKTLATAESCTGGIIAASFTETPGSSTWFHEGFITYANEAKSGRLGVPEAVIAEHGAVSEPVAAAMARGARRVAGVDFALSVTGIAGPSGATQDKPVGQVFLGLADEAGVSVSERQFGPHLTREEVRDRASKTAINLLRLRLLEAQA